MKKPIDMNLVQLEAVNIELKTEIESLKTQIEKMKCCVNCKSYVMNYLPYYCNKKNEPRHCFEKCDKWELKEK